MRQLKAPQMVPRSSPVESIIQQDEIQQFVLAK